MSALTIVAPMFKGKDDIRNSSWYRAVKIVEHGMKVLKRVLEKRLHRIVTVNEMQFCCMFERGKINDVLTLRRLQ